MKTAPRDRFKAWLPLLPAVLAGVALRLYLLPDQILLDDEWHALNFVLERPFFTLFLHQGLGANCIPDNLYTSLLLHTVGWSEMLLRLPSILCGILALIVFPLMIQKIWGKSVAVIFAWLLAVAPCVIFYSRLCRPYAKVMFFGMLALLALFRWVREGRRSFMFLYAFSGFAAMYYHLYATFFVLPPLFVLLGLRAVLKDRDYVQKSLPSYRQVIEAGIVVALLVAIFIVPPNLLNPWWTNVGGCPGATWRTWLGLLSLLSGVHAAVLQALCLALAVSGFCLILRDNLAIGAMLLGSLFCFALQISFSTQQAMEMEIQVARYGIILFPIWFLCAAASLARILERAAARMKPAAARWLPTAGAASFAALFLYFGPLPAIERRPNNFTNHKAFQITYEPTDWSVSRDVASGEWPVMEKKNIPKLYSALAAFPDLPGVIESPMYLGDGLNLYYYYQLLHRKPVAILYAPVRFAPLPSHEEYIYGTTHVEYVLNRVPAELTGKIHFKNMLPLSDVARMKASFHGWAVVVHYHSLTELSPGYSAAATDGLDNVLQKATVAYLRSNGFPLVFEDGQAAVLRVP